MLSVKTCLAILLFGLILPLNISVADEDICWKDSYGRGVGTIPTNCPAGKEYNAGFCYKPCRSGYKGAVTMCLPRCPKNFTDTGLHCLKPKAYGRGTGFAYVPLIESRATAKTRCEDKHGRGNCERSLEMYYPKCRTGFKPVGCCVCSPKCPSNTTDIGVSCQMNTYDRGVGSLPICQRGKDYDAGLCYTPCRNSTTGVGPVCWSSCPRDYPVNCGAACAKSSAQCALAIVNQVTSTGDVVLNITALVATGGTANAALTAARTAAKTAGKTVLSVAARKAAKTTIKNRLKAQMKKAPGWDDYAGKALEKTGQMEMFAEAMVNAKEEGEFDPTTLFEWESLDPTGVASVVSAFNKPICGTPKIRTTTPIRPAIPVNNNRHQQACTNAIQGKIAWDYQGHKQWSPANINNLCRGAESSREPANCFHQVMHTGINWGGGTKWKWSNALNLCQGSTNARRTIQCFQQKIAQKASWSQAIKQCKR